MAEPASLIMLQFLAWVADRPRTYADTMEAWRSTCPRLSVWEDAVIERLVRCEGGRQGAVTLTPRGRATLGQSRDMLASDPPSLVPPQPPPLASRSQTAIFQRSDEDVSSDVS